MASRRRKADRDGSDQDLERADSAERKQRVQTKEVDLGMISAKATDENRHHDTPKCAMNDRDPGHDVSHGDAHGGE